MSSFIPSSEHFNSCQNAVEKLALNSQFRFPYSLKDVCPPNSQSGPVKIGLPQIDF